MAEWPTLYKLKGVALPNERMRTIAIALLVILLAAAFLFWANAPSGDARRLLALQHEMKQRSATPQAVEFTSSALPHQVQKRGFRSSESCRECHSQQFESWHGSFHRTMTQVASPDTVVAPFEGVQIASRGRVYYLSREGDEFFVTMADPDWEAGAAANGVNLELANPPIVKLPIVMTTGSHHMQGYWVPSKTPNMLRQVPVVYLIADQRWVPREDIFIEPPDAPRHMIVWNDNCIVCHAVDGTPNFDLQRMTVNTEVAELGISCEACHGPGESHIAFRRAASSLASDAEQANKSNSESADPIINPATCNHQISSEICGQCHSYFLPHDQDLFGREGYSYVAGGDLRQSHALVTYEIAKKYENEMAMSVFWNDGTCRVSGREYTGMVESSCFVNGELSCVSCHSMHDSHPVNQLAANMESNAACTQCHASIAENLESHTHHPVNSSGSLCYNCHMPYTSYGLLKALRSHRIQSPQIAGQEANNRPNACNLCHLDQTQAWTADKLSQWYGQPPADLPKPERETSAALLWLLRGDASQRAIAAWHMNWEPALEVSGREWQTPFLAELLDDSYTAVRYLAGKSLRSRSEFEDLPYDYIGTPRSRQTIREQLLERWRQSAQALTPERAGPLLLDAQTGQVRLEELRELLRQQDKRPVIMPE